MNTKSLLTRIGVPILSIGLLGGLGATLATSASAATLPAASTMASVQHAVTVRGLTFQRHIEDTTSVPTSVTDPIYGPVWAYDDLARTAVATHDATDPALWYVTLYSDGAYHAFADPRTGAPHTCSGVVAGWVTYEVHTSGIPSQSHLKLTEPSSMRSGDILKAFFGNPADFTISTSHYNFNYYGLPGGVYNQAG